jgi:hypothetical protein
MRETPGQKNPDGSARMVPDTDRLFQRLMALSTRPVPADAPLLKKVQAAQVYEACQYLSKLRARIALTHTCSTRPRGVLRSDEYRDYFAALGDFYRVAIELEDTPASKFALAQDRLLVLRVPEFFLEGWVKSGDSMSSTLNLARFRRLQAEAAFLTAPPPGGAPRNREASRQPLIDVAKPPGLSPDPFTAFPDLKLPMREVRGLKEPEIDRFPDLKLPMREVLKEPDIDRPFQRLIVIAGRPVPADAALLRKLRIAQLNEGIRYARSFAARFDLGLSTGTEPTYLATLSDVYSVAIELEETAVGKAALAEDRILAYWIAELFLERRVKSDADSSHLLHLARFHRLQAEAAFLMAHPTRRAPTHTEMPRPPRADVAPSMGWPPAFTVFPNLKLPMQESPEFKNSDGSAVMVPNLDKLEERLKVIMTRPVPANSPPLRKVRAAQIPEWVAYYREYSRPRVGIICYQSFEDIDHFATLDEVYRAAADLEDTAMGKVTFAEDRILAYRERVRYIEARVRNGADPPHNLPFARFHMLQAEADLLRLKADLKANQ